MTWVLAGAYLRLSTLVTAAFAEPHCWTQAVRRQQTKGTFIVSFDFRIYSDLRVLERCVRRQPGKALQRERILESPCSGNGSSPNLPWRFRSYVFFHKEIAGSFQTSAFEDIVHMFPMRDICWTGCLTLDRLLSSNIGQTHICMFHTPRDGHRLPDQLRYCAHTCAMH